MRSEAIGLSAHSSAPRQTSAKRQYRLSDWLALHCLDRSKCKQILQFAEESPTGIEGARATLPSVKPSEARPDQCSVDQPGAALVPDNLGSSEAWSLAASSLSRRYPSHRSLIERVKENTITEFQPDTSRYPLAFTLKRDSDIYPYVSCSYQGRVADLIAIGHEFGHAVQLVASGGAFVPPVMRELCAYLGELSLLEQLKDEHTSLHSLVSTVREAQIDRFRRDKILNQSVLDRSNGKYDYRWNYLLAHALSTQSYKSLEPDFQWRCFAGQVSASAVLEAIIKTTKTEKSNPDSHSW